MRILHVVGARPNFVKAAPVLRALAARGARQFLVHTGQHYDGNMSRVFFEELGLPQPDVNLEVGSGSHAFQTAEVMKRIESVLQEQAPDLVLVYGDVNSTVAAALVACKLQMRTGHVEAGLRSFDRTMPEEINRVLTDQIADLLFTHSPDADANLEREGVPARKVHFVGNVMIDTLVRLLPRARPGGMPGRPPYVLVTLHRPSNVDDAPRLRATCRALERIGEQCPLAFPVHPRTRGRLADLGIGFGSADVRLLDPVGYLDFLGMEADAGAVITDSGGVQEETTYLGVPCFTLRGNTERPITITCGTNTLVGDDIESLHRLVIDSLGRERPRRDPPEYWDGRAAERIADVVTEQNG